MTNKEAQLTLANLKRYISGGGAVDRGTNNAIDMAIEALSKPEIVMYNDCISRQQAIEMCREPRMRNADCSDFEMEIMMLPPIQFDISYIISETLHECGIYGEEATVKPIGTPKRLGRDDLLPPCVR